MPHSTPPRTSRRSAILLPVAHAGADAYDRAEGNWGLGRYDDANAEFRAAVAQNDKSALYRVRWGRCCTSASTIRTPRIFSRKRSKATKIRARLPWSRSRQRRRLRRESRRRVDKAIELDPKLVEAHELMANLALEDSNTKIATEEADKAIELSLTRSMPWHRAHQEKA